MSVFEERTLVDEIGRDMELAQILGRLDPAGEDPAYWNRFRGWVMSRTAGELMRRRLMAKLTMEDVLSSWARAVLPTAMLAAAIAGLVLMRAHAVDAPLPIGVEELLLTDIHGLSIPMTLSNDPAAALVFASEVF